MSRSITNHQLYSSIREVLEQARSKAYQAEYGKALVQELSKKLTQDISKGFSPQSLWYMRQFYQTFPNLSAVWRESSDSSSPWRLL